MKQVKRSKIEETSNDTAKSLSIPNQKDQNGDENKDNNIQTHPRESISVEEHLKIAEQVNIYEIPSTLLHNKDESLAKKILQDTLQCLKSSFSPSELKIWLIDSFCDSKLLSLIDKRTKRKEFMRILEGEKNIKKEFATDFFLPLCKNTRLASQIAKIISEYPDLLKNFFFDFDFPQRLKKWFTFKFSGDNEKGALALEQYLFFHRDTLWSRLEWTGKRNIPPVVAVYKKNLLMELDLVHALLVVSRSPQEIKREVELEEIMEREKQSLYTKGKIMPEAEDEFGRMRKLQTPEEIRGEESPAYSKESGNQACFWASDFFKDSLSHGDFLELDYHFFANVLSDTLDGKIGTRKQRERVLDLIEDYIEMEDFKTLAYQLLPLVANESLFSFLNRFHSIIQNKKDHPEDMIHKMRNTTVSFLLDLQASSLDEFMLFNVLLTHPGDFFETISQSPQMKQRFDNLLNETFPLEKSTLTKEGLVSTLSASQKRNVLLANFLNYFLIQSSFVHSAECISIIMKHCSVSFSVETEADEELDPLVQMKKRKKEKKLKKKKEKKLKKEIPRDDIQTKFLIEGDMISLARTPVYLYNLVCTLLIGKREIDRETK